MSGSHDDLDDIVQSFVHTDLASLDRIGGEPESFTLSPHLTETSPSLQQQSPAHTTGSFATAPSRSAREGPDLAAAPVVPATPQPPTRAAHDLPEAPAERPPNPEAAAPGARTHAARQPSVSGPSVRNVSSSSTTSVSTQEREKRGSLGDKFKMFGKRITSGGSRK